MINYSIAIMSAKPGTKKQDFAQVGTKAYGVSQVTEVLDIDAFAEHMANHNSPFSKGMIAGVLTDATKCLREMMLEGKKVKLGDFGAFYVELETEGARTTNEFSTQNIKKVNVRYCPGEKVKNLRDDATFQLVPNRTAQADAIEVIKNEDTIQGLE